MELPDAVALAPHAAHSAAGMSGLAYVVSPSSEGEGDDKAVLLTCGADGVLSSRPMADNSDANSASAASAPLPDATSIPTGASLTPLTCLAASRGVIAVGDESNYVRVRTGERERKTSSRLSSFFDFSIRATTLT